MLGHAFHYMQDKSNSMAKKQVFERSDTVREMKHKHKNLCRLQMLLGQIDGVATLTVLAVALVEFEDLKVYYHHQHHGHKHKVILLIIRQVELFTRYQSNRSSIVQFSIQSFGL